VSRTVTFQEVPSQRVGARLREALCALPPHSCVIVDFDETLWLRNSTEEYLGTLRPRFMAVAVLAFLDLVRPWALFRPHGDETHQDWIRVLVTTLLLPWSIPLWNHNAARHAKDWENRELIETLKSSQLTIFIATFGFGFVVRPLLKRIVPEAKLCACGSFWSGHRIRRVGKKQAVLRQLRPDVLSEAIVITDSIGDTDILEACRTPLLIRWFGAKYIRAGSASYLPFLYTQKAKRPGGNYLMYGVLPEDVVLLCIAIAWLMPEPLLGAVGLLLLHLSFWIIYEIGYVENDLLATKYEDKPNLSAYASAYASRMKPRVAWMAALLVAAPGMALIAVFNAESLRIKGEALLTYTGYFAGADIILPAYLAWIGYLFAARATFWLYNRADIKQRAYFYVCLQIFRTLGYAYLFRTNFVGMSLLLALALARWVPYLVYRFAGSYEPRSYRLLLLFYFLILTVSGIPIFDGILSFQYCVAFIWLIVLAHKQIFQLLWKPIQKASRLFRSNFSV
jgi:hypothetical protein